MIKAAQRRIMRDKRDRVSSDETAILSKIIYHKFFNLPVQPGKKYFVYNSFQSEVDTSEIIDRLRHMGNKVYLPRVAGEHMEAVLIDGKTRFIKDKWGIEEPKSGETATEFDVIIVPLLAFDRSCNRLGYGKGYYDKFMTDKKALKIGLAYSFQEVEKIVADKFDVKLDIIVTDREVISADNRRKV